MKKRIYWNFELACVEGSKYKTLAEFTKKCQSAVNWLRRNDKLDELCKKCNLIQAKDYKTYHTLESAHKEALKYQGRLEFYKKNNSAYNWATTNKKLDEICGHMEVKQIKWNFKKVKEVSLKCKTRQEFKQRFSGAHYWARKNNQLDLICSHLPEKPILWEYKSVKKEALKCESRKKFKEFSKSAYNWALNNNVIDEVCSHMEKIREIWDYKKAKEASLKYDKLLDFCTNSSGAYVWAKRNGYLNEFSSHMKKLTFWDYSSAKEESLKYRTRKEFNSNNSGAYQWAYKNNFLEEFCSHMTRGIVGFNPEKKGFTYYIRIDKDGDTVYKIGITNRTIEERFGKEQMKYITLIYLWEYENGADARILEKDILKEYSYAKYNGSDILDSGNTEMFIDDILMLDNNNIVKIEVA